MTRTRFASSLALLCLPLADLFVVAPLETEALHIQPVGAVFVVLLSVALLILSRSLVPVIGIIAVVGLLAVAVIVRMRGRDALDISLQATAWLLIALVIIWTVGRAVFGPGRITYHRIVGAILLYLTIGLVFVALYTLVGAHSPGAFSGLQVSARVSLPSDLVYFSFTTLTTLGYGDIMPVHPIARSLTNRAFPTGSCSSISKRWAMTPPGRPIRRCSIPTPTPRWRWRPSTPRAFASAPVSRSPVCGWRRSPPIPSPPSTSWRPAALSWASAPATPPCASWARTR
jgi:hypothetical protein